MSQSYFGDYIFFKPVAYKKLHLGDRKDGSGVRRAGCLNMGLKFRFPVQKKKKLDVTGQWWQ